MTTAPAKDSKRIRCAIYIRVSTEEQVERARLREQQDRLPQLAAERGWKYTVIEDLGISGRTIEARPGMTRLLAMIVADQVDTVLVIEQSRLTRDTTLEDLGRIIRACQEHAVAIATPERTYRPDDLDDFVMLGIQGVLSAAEVRRLAKRAHEGISRIASEGRYTGGIVPYGYRVSTDGFFTIHEPEAAVVREMYAWLVDEHLSLYAIQQRLNEIGIHPPNQDERRPPAARERGKRTRRTSNRWQGFTVKRILSSSFYAGERVYGKRSAKTRALITGSVPAVVSRERYEQALVRLAEQKKRHARGQRYDYPLKGKIRCGACGHAYSGAFDQTVQHGTVCRYSCTGTGRANERGTSCDNPSVRADTLEPLIWNDIVRFLSQPNLVLSDFDTHHDEHADAVTRRQEQERALQQRHSALAKEVESWLDLFPKAIRGETAGLTLEDIDRRVAELRTELARVEDNLARLSTWSEELTLRAASRRNLEQLLQRLTDRLDNPSPADKQTIIQQLVRSITITADRDETGRPLYRYERRTRPDGSFWYAHRVSYARAHVVYAFGEDDFPANEDSEVLAHAQRFIVPTSWKRAGKTTRPAARATETKPSSSGCRSASSDGRANSASSSRRRTPRWARLASPGRSPGPPPTIAAVEALWCGARNGGSAISGCSGGSSPATEWIRVTSSAASGSSGGRIPGRRRPSIVFPVPGGPPKRRLCPPAAASSRARRARSCPRTSARSAGGGRSWNRGARRRIRRQLAAQVCDRVREMPDRHRLDAGQRRLRRALPRAEQPLEPHPPRPFRHRQDTADPAEPSVQGELAHSRMPFELGVRHLPGGREDGESDREVEPGPLLPQLRGRQVDGDASAGELELRRQDSAADSLARLLAGTVGEPHDREGRDTVLDVRFDLDPAGLEPDERMGEGACEHASTLRAPTSYVPRGSAPLARRSRSRSVQELRPRGHAAGGIVDSEGGGTTTPPWAGVWGNGLLRPGLRGRGDPAQTGRATRTSS